MIPPDGRLRRENNVVTSVYGRTLINQSVVGLLKAHRFARQIDEVELPLEETLPLLRAMNALKLGAASIDPPVSACATSRSATARGWRISFAASLPGSSVARASTIRDDGRRRCLPRAHGRVADSTLIGYAGGGRGLRLRAIVVRRGSDQDLVKRASLLRRDSVHGPFEGTITVDPKSNTILANGTLIQVIYSDNPATIDYTAHDIHDALVVDNTEAGAMKPGCLNICRARASPGCC